MSAALDAIIALDDDCITPKAAAAVIGCHEHTIRIVAREQPWSLGFPVIVIGTRTRIPRIPFINFVLKGEAFDDASDSDCRTGDCDDNAS